LIDRARSARDAPCFVVVTPGFLRLPRTPPPVRARATWVERPASAERRATRRFTDPVDAASTPCDRVDRPRSARSRAAQDGRKAGRTTAAGPRGPAAA